MSFAKPHLAASGKRAMVRAEVHYVLYMPAGPNDPPEIGLIGGRDCNSCRGGAPHLLTPRAPRGKY